MWGNVSMKRQFSFLEHLSTQLLLVCVHRSDLARLVLALPQFPYQPQPLFVTLLELLLGAVADDRLRHAHTILNSVCRTGR